MYLDKRYKSLIKEAELRGLSTIKTKEFTIDIFKTHDLYKDYTPT